MSFCMEDVCRLEPFSDLIQNSTGNSSHINFDLQVTGSIWRYGSPILLFVGTVGNVMSLLVLTRRRLRQQTTMFYLTVLALADLFVLYTGLLRLYLDNVFHVFIRLQSDFACKFHTFLVFFSLDLSVWVLVAVTTDRCLYVSAPFTARKWCTLHRARMVICVIICVLFIINMHYFWTTSIIYQESPSIAGDGTYNCYTSKVPRLAHFIEKVWPWIDFCVVCFVPFVVMLVCSILIIRQIVESKRKLRKHNDVQPGAKVGHQSEINVSEVSRSVNHLEAALPACYSETGCLDSFAKSEEIEDIQKICRPVPDLVIRTESTCDKLPSGLQNEAVHDGSTSKFPMSQRYQNIHLGDIHSSPIPEEKQKDVSTSSESNDRYLHNRNDDVDRSQISAPITYTAQRNINVKCSRRLWFLARHRAIVSSVPNEEQTDNKKCLPSSVLSATLQWNPTLASSVKPRKEFKEEQQRATLNRSRPTGASWSKYSASNKAVDGDVEEPMKCQTKNVLLPQCDTQLTANCQHYNSNPGLIPTHVDNSRRIDPQAINPKMTFDCQKQRRSHPRQFRECQNPGDIEHRCQTAQAPEEYHPLQRDRDLLASAPKSESGPGCSPKATTRRPRHSSMTPLPFCGIPSISFMLLAVNVLFWLLTAPIAVYIIGYMHWSPVASSEEHARLTLGWSVVNMLQYTNNAIHFFLYCLTGPRFRRELASLCSCVPHQAGRIRSSGVTVD